MLLRCILPVGKKEIRENDIRVYEYESKNAPEVELTHVISMKCCHGPVGGGRRRVKRAHG